jgi:hypothetical protein
MTITESPAEVRRPSTEGDGWPLPPTMKAARVLSVVLALILAATSAAGLFARGLYQDAEPVTAMLRGYDLVALVLAVPLLVVVLLPSRRRSPRARLLWVAVLAYVVYDYAFYVFGTTFNDLFLLHVAVFSLAAFALPLALSSIDVRRIAQRFHERTPARTVGTVLIVLGTALGAMWVVGSLGFTVTGTVPEEPSHLVLPTAFTHLGWALDLSLLVPAYVLAGILLWRRAPWGFALSTMLLASSVLHQMAYLTALPFQVDARIAGASAFDPAEVPIVVAFVAGTALLLYHCDRRPRAVAWPPTAAGDNDSAFAVRGSVADGHAIDATSRAAVAARPRDKLDDPWHRASTPSAPRRGGLRSRPRSTE